MMTKNCSQGRLLNASAPYVSESATPALFQSTYPEVLLSESAWSASMSGSQRSNLRLPGALKSWMPLPPIETGRIEMTRQEKTALRIGRAVMAAEGWREVVAQI